MDAPEDGRSYYYDPVFLEAISESLTTGRELTPEQMEYLKHLKNTGDDLRNFFLLFSTDHQGAPWDQASPTSAGKPARKAR